MTVECRTKLVPFDICAPGRALYLPFHRNMSARATRGTPRRRGRPPRRCAQRHDITQGAAMYPCPGLRRQDQQPCEW